MNRTTPEVVLKTRVRGEEDNTFHWANFHTNQVFANKRVVIFALPGAFTPTCSSTHLPGYEELYDEITAKGIDEIYCLSVNDAFVMFHWANHLGIKKVKMLPDGNGEFTRKMGMLVEKTNLGFGMRSWRYSMVVNDNNIEKMFIEPIFRDNSSNDPFEVSDADTMLEYLSSV